jgi:ubiquitin C-terminal hydrolase
VRDAKLDNAVRFPMKDLDLGEHLTHFRANTSLANQGLSKISETQVPSQNTSKTPEKQPQSPQSPPNMLYDLCAVVNHVGTLSKGHYFAHVLEGGQWWLCDDGKPPVVIDAQEVMDNSETGNPYILFYSRKKYSPYS